MGKTNLRHLAIIGAGGHGKVIADAAMLMERYESIVFLDDKYGELSSPLGLNIIGPIDRSNDIIKTHEFIVGIGSNDTRAKLYRSLLAEGYIMAKIIHPSAVVSHSAFIAAGSFIAASATINPDVNIFENNIINTSCSIDHDCIIESSSHIAPNSTLCGNVRVGQKTLIGAASVVREGVTIGERCIVGAGAVVINNVSPHTTVVGNPVK